MRPVIPLGALLLMVTLSAFAVPARAEDGVCVTMGTPPDVDPSCTIDYAPRIPATLLIKVCNAIGHPANEMCFWGPVTDVTREVGDTARDLGRPGFNIAPLPVLP